MIRRKMYTFRIKLLDTNKIKSSVIFGYDKAEAERNLGVHLERDYPKNIKLLSMKRIAR